MSSNLDLKFKIGRIYHISLLLEILILLHPEDSLRFLWSLSRSSRKLIPRLYNLIKRKTAKYGSPRNIESIKDLSDFIENKNDYFICKLGSRNLSLIDFFKLLK